MDSDNFDSDNPDDDAVEEECESEADYEEDDDFCLDDDSVADCKRSVYDENWAAAALKQPINGSFSFKPAHKALTKFGTPSEAFYSIMMVQIIER